MPESLSATRHSLLRNEETGTRAAGGVHTPAEPKPFQGNRRVSRRASRGPDPRKQALVPGQGSLELVHVGNCSPQRFLQATQHRKTRPQSTR